MTTACRGSSVTVIDYRCTARCGQRPFLEQHAEYSVSYVRKGTFGYHTRGRTYEAVAGSVLLGHAGDEFLCSHEHMGGDECLLVTAAPELAETFPKAAWRQGALPPVAELVVLGQLADVCATRAGDEGGLDEAAMLLVTRAMALAVDRPVAPITLRARDRRHMIDAALWIDAHCAEDIRLESAAREASLSPYHFLRLFRAVLGTHRRQLHDLPWRELPDGAFVMLDDGEPAVLIGDAVRIWTPRGYGAPHPRPRHGRAAVLTPPSAVRAIRAGYAVHLDHSAVS